MIKRIIGFFKNLRDEQRRMCFEEHHSGNVCYGMIGGDTPDYLNGACLNCPYYEVYTPK